MPVDKRGSGDITIGKMVYAFRALIILKHLNHYIAG